MISSTAPPGTLNPRLYVAPAAPGTSFEFVSKLGFNLRGAARNYTQRLLDFVSFGWSQTTGIKNYLDAQGIENSELFSTNSFVISDMRKVGNPLVLA